MNATILKFPRVKEHAKVLTRPKRLSFSFISSDLFKATLVALISLLIGGLL